MIQKIDHVGIAVKDLDMAVNFLKDVYGAEVLWRKVFTTQKLESAFIRLGESQFEVSMSTDPEGVIAKFIEQKGEGIHHISLQVDNINNATKQLSEKGLKLSERLSDDDFEIVFVHPQDNLGVLFEIIERKS